MKISQQQQATALLAAMQALDERAAELERVDRAALDWQPPERWVERGAGASSTCASRTTVIWSSFESWWASRRLPRRAPLAMRRDVASVVCRATARSVDGVGPQAAGAKDVAARARAHAPNVIARVSRPSAGDRGAHRAVDGLGVAADAHGIARLASDSHEHWRRVHDARAARRAPFPADRRQAGVVQGGRATARRGRALGAYASVVIVPSPRLSVAAEP